MLQVSSWEANSSSAGQEIPKNLSKRIILLSFLIFYNYHQILYNYLSRIPTLLRAALFWDSIQHRMAVPLQCFRTTYQSLLIFKGKEWKSVEEFIWFRMKMTGRLL